MCVCVQGLLKVAIDNARAQEKQVQLEKTELKMELYRERELRETLERQLCVEQKNRGHYHTQKSDLGPFSHVQETVTPYQRKSYSP